MKKVISLMLALVCIALVACTADTPAVIDVSAAAREICDKLTFRDTISEIDGDAVAYYYGDAVKGLPCAVYVGSGATAEQVALFEAKDEADAEVVLEAMKAHIESEKKSFGGYIPEEVAVLENAAAVKRGRYVALVVCADENTSKVTLEAMK